jgi:hypothetical protein
MVGDFQGLLVDGNRVGAVFDRYEANSPNRPKLDAGLATENSRFAAVADIAGEALGGPLASG